MDTPDDCFEIAAKFGEDLDRYLGVADGSIARYKQFMRSSKVARDNGVISNDEYKRLREVARFILPEGRMTELYITYYLSDFYDNFLKLRDSEHAQTEHIWIAQEMRRTLEEAQG
jgi:thymidylate synthase ThyX